AEDVYSQAEIGEAVAEVEVKGPELELARQVIDSLVAEFEPRELVSEYRRDLRAMLEAKVAGEQITAPEPEPAARVIDRMEEDRRRGAEAQARRRESGRGAAEARRSRGAPVELGRSQAAEDGAAASACSCAWKSVLSILPW